MSDYNFDKKNMECEPLWRAVYRVYCENTEQEDKGCSDDPPVLEELRQDNWKRTRSHWMDETGMKARYFFLSVDAVAIIYLSIRKRPGDWHARFGNLFNGAAP